MEENNSEQIEIIKGKIEGVSKIQYRGKYQGKSATWKGENEDGSEVLDLNTNYDKLSENWGSFFASVYTSSQRGERGCNIVT